MGAKDIACVRLMDRPYGLAEGVKTNPALTVLNLASTLQLVSMPRLGLGREASELEELKVTVKAMEQTIQEMNRKIAEMKKQRAVPRPHQGPNPSRQFQGSRLRPTWARRPC